MVIKQRNKFLNKIIIGSAQLKNGYGLDKSKVNKRELFKILNYAKKNKIQFLDTAQVYGNSEIMIGRRKKDNLKIISKFFLNQKTLRNPENWFLNQFKKTSKNLKTKNVYGILIHNPSFLTKKKEIFNYFKKLKNLNLVKKIGFSIYSEKDLIFILNNFNFDIIQLPYSIFDRRFEKYFKILKKRKIKIHCRSIFLQGLLINLKHQRKKYFLSWRAVFDKFNNWIRNNKPNHLSACLSFVFANKYLDKIIIGVNTKKNLEEILSTKIYEKKIFPKFGTRDKKLLNPVNWKL